MNPLSSFILDICDLRGYSVENHSLYGLDGRRHYFISLRDTNGKEVARAAGLTSELIATLKVLWQLLTNKNTKQ